MPSLVEILIEDQFAVDSYNLVYRRQTGYTEKNKNVPSDLFPFHCGVIEKKIPFEVIGSSSNLLVTVEKSKDPKLLLVFREMKLAGCSFKIDDH